MFRFNPSESISDHALCLPAHVITTSVNGSSSPLELTSPRISVLTLGEDENRPGILTFHQKKLLPCASQCTHDPKILVFRNVSSQDDTLARPHLFVYDAKLRRLECHVVSLDACSLIAHVDVDLKLIQCNHFANILTPRAVIAYSQNTPLNEGHSFIDLALLPGPQLLILAAREEPNVRPVLDVFEWTPYKKKILRGRLAQTLVAGIVSSPEVPEWHLVCSHGSETESVMTSRQATLITDSLASGSAPLCSTFQLVPEMYRSNIQYIFMDPRQYGSSQSWIQIESRELIHVVNGAVRWSVPLANLVYRITIAELQAGRHCSQSCLLVQTESAERIFDASTGMPMTEWVNTAGLVVLEDARTISLRAALRSHLGNKQALPIETQPIHAPGPQSSKLPLSMASPAQGIQRAQTNLEDALKAIREQISKKQKKGTNIQRTLVHKHEVLDSLYESLNGPLRDVLAPSAPQWPAKAPVILQESMIFQRKQAQYRDKVVQRLTCITGGAQQIELPTNTSGEEKYPSAYSKNVTERTLEMSQHQAGQILSDSGDLILWRSLRLRNLSEMRIFKLRLSLGHDQSASCVVPFLEPEESALLVSAAVLDRSFLDSSILSGKTHFVNRFFSGPSLVHMSRYSHSLQSLDDCLVTFAAPSFPLSDHTPASIHSILLRLVPIKAC